MKKIFYLISLITLTTITEAQAQQTDLQLLEQTFNYYLSGLINNDAETLKKAFHPDATMKWIGTEYTSVNAIEGLTAGMNPSSKLENVKTRIISVHIAGKAASAQLEIEFPTFTFIDFMNVLKINGNWQIVSKVYYQRLKN